MPQSSLDKCSRSRYAYSMDTNLNIQAGMRLDEGNGQYGTITHVATSGIVVRWDSDGEEVGYTWEETYKLTKAGPEAYV